MGGRALLQPPGPLVIPYAVLPHLTLLPTLSWDLLEEKGTGFILPCPSDLVHRKTFNQCHMFSTGPAWYTVVLLLLSHLQLQETLNE